MSADLTMVVAELTQMHTVPTIQEVTFVDATLDTYSKTIVSPSAWVRKWYHSIVVINVIVSFVLYCIKVSISPVLLLFVAIHRMLYQCGHVFKENVYLPRVYVDKCTKYSLSTPSVLTSVHVILPLINIVLLLHSHANLGMDALHFY